MAHSVCEREGELHKVHSRPFGVDCTQEKSSTKIGKNTVPSWENFKEPVPSTSVIRLTKP